MRINISKVCFTLLFLVSLTSVGCGGSGSNSVVEAPSAEMQAAAEARQAEYQKSMNDSYGKKGN